MRARTGPVAVLAIAALACLPGAAASARSIDRAEATKIARSILQPQRERGVGTDVRLYSSKTALPAGTVISEIGPGENKVKLRDPGWLFWADLGHGLLFPHPSKVIVLDARSGRMVARGNLTVYPLVDGRVPSFLRERGVSQAAREAPPLATRAPDLSKDGMVTIGQRTDPVFKRAFEQADKLAKDLKVKKVDAKPSVQGLGAAIAELVALGKDDIALFIGGHGYPKEDKYYTDKDGKKQLAAPGSRKPKLDLETTDNTGTSLTSTQLAGVLRKYPGVQFKVVIESCYGGRFLDDLKELNAEGGPRNVAVAMSSANDSEPSTTGFFEAIGNGLRRWAEDAAADADLADGLREAFAGKAVKSWGDVAIEGGVHPQITPKPPVAPAPPPPAAPCTSTLVRSPGAEPFPAANHIRVRATCNQPIRKVVVRSLSGDTFDACAQTQGTGSGCSGFGDTLTAVWNQPANQELELFGRVTGNAGGTYRVQIFGNGDVLLHEYEGTVPP